jgi:cytoskeletal protein CcmA (bactofilin family)
MNAITVVILAAALALSPAAAAQQSELDGKVRSGREVTVPATETVQGDLLASGGTVRIDGRVDGDLVASGGQVIVAGTVTGDLLAAAGTTTVSGQVDGDARLASGQARIEGRVGEDLLLGVGQATVTSEAQIGGDLVFGAGRVRVDGAVAGSILGSTGNYARDGSVGGSERVNIQQPEAEQEPTLADRTVDALRRFVSLLVVGALLLWLAPRVLRGAADAARGRPLASFGIGILGVIGVVLALVLLVLATVLLAVVLGLLGLGSLTGLTVFGGLLVTAGVVFLFVLAVAFAAQATVGLALGRLVLPGLDRSFLGRLGALALGVLVVVLVAAIPLVGGWLEALLVLLGLGALLLLATPGRRRASSAPGDAVPSALDR